MMIAEIMLDCPVKRSIAGQECGPSLGRKVYLFDKVVQNILKVIRSGPNDYRNIALARVHLELSKVKTCHFIAS